MAKIKNLEITDKVQCYKFLLEHSESMDLFYIGVTENDFMVFVRDTKENALNAICSIAQGVSVNVFTFPVHIIEENLVGETDDLVIIDFIKIKSEDVPTYTETQE